MPSSLCGVVGLKPPRGLITSSGTIPISFSRDATGPIARRVAGVAVVGLPIGAGRGIEVDLHKRTPQERGKQQTERSSEDEWGA